jgi:hypothetical protein
MRRFAFVLILLLAGPILAQEQEPVLEPGDKVRVTDSSFVAIGTVEEVTASHLRVHVRSVEAREGYRDAALPSDRVSVRWRMSELDSLEVSVGRGKGHAVRGAVIGGGVALLPGLVLGAGASDCINIYGGSTPDCDSLKGTAVFFSTVFLGAGVGALIGSLAAHDIWEPVDLPAKPILTVQPNSRFSVGLTIPVRR